MGFATTLLAIIRALCPDAAVPNKSVYVLNVVFGSLILVVIGLLFFHRGKRGRNLGASSR